MRGYHSFRSLVHYLKNGQETTRNQMVYCRDWNDTKILVRFQKQWLRAQCIAGEYYVYL